MEGLDDRTDLDVLTTEELRKYDRRVSKMRDQSPPPSERAGGPATTAGR